MPMHLRKWTHAKSPETRPERCLETSCGAPGETRTHTGRVLGEWKLWYGSNG